MSDEQKHTGADQQHADCEAILKASGTPYTIDDTAVNKATLRWTPQDPTPPTA